MTASEAPGHREPDATPRPAARLAEAGVDHRLEPVWEDKPGLWGFATTVDHKRLGIRYLVTAFAFFFLAGSQALLLRTQLAEPDNSLIGPEAYNELFTMHGVSMIFLFNTPVFAGFANYLIPLQLGARDLAFPRLNAFSYWVYLFAGVFMYASYLTGDIPDGGWFAYVPLTDVAYSPGLGIDFWGLGVAFIGISTTAGAINFIVTIFKLRAPGMTLNRMPVFVWSILAMSFMVLFAVPAVTEAALLLEMDRLVGTAFFDASQGGSPVLYQHLFWFWGHPEVYILFIPAVGIVTTIIPVFARVRLVAYVWAVGAIVAIAFVSFGVWVHHMFATGLPAQAMAYFSAASLVIAIPNGVLYAVWVLTMVFGRVRWTAAMKFAVGFLVIFVLGGVTGVMVAVMPFDWQAHDTYFVVAHFHYVLAGGVVFPVFAGLYHWVPKMTGRMLSERLGSVSFWLMFVSFQIAFFPMHVLGLLGMPRRVYTYRDGFGWETLNLVSTVGAFLLGLGTLVTVVNIVHSRRRGAPAGPDPWEADSLEWATTSPPPEHNFRAMPIVRSRHPLWDPPPAPLAAATGDPASHAALGPQGAAARMSAVTSGLETAPEQPLAIPEPSAVPIATAAGLAILVVGLLVETVLVGAIGAGVLVVGAGWWMWHTEDDLR